MIWNDMLRDAIGVMAIINGHGYQTHLVAFSPENPAMSHLQTLIKAIFVYCVAL